MPCRYVIDKERKLVITKAWGVLTFAEAMAHQDQLAVDPEFSREFSQLIDATAVTAIEASTPEVRKLAARRLFSSVSRRALVATNPAFYGIGRMLQSYLELAKAEEQVAVFRDLESALKWLGLEGYPEIASSI